MKYHETRRKIIREWIALPKDKRQTEEQVAAFAQKAAERQPARSDYGMATAAHRQVLTWPPSELISQNSGIQRPPDACERFL